MRGGHLCVHCHAYHGRAAEEVIATKRVGYSSRALSRREALWVHCIFGCAKMVTHHHHCINACLIALLVFLGDCAAMLCMRLAAQSVSGFAGLPDSALEGDSDCGVAFISEPELRGRFQVRQLRLT